MKGLSYFYLKKLTQLDYHCRHDLKHIWRIHLKLIQEAGDYLPNAQENLQKGMSLSPVLQKFTLREHILSVSIYRHHIHDKNKSSGS